MNMHRDSVESHAGLLIQPPPNQLLYKTQKPRRFLKGEYLHFQRIDAYSGEGADLNDGKQPTKMQQMSSNLYIGERSNGWSVDRYFNDARARTYAFCSSLSNENFIQTRLRKGDHCSYGSKKSIKINCHQKKAKHLLYFVRCAKYGCHNMCQKGNVVRS
jgi:hypothetical protein